MTLKYFAAFLDNKKGGGLIDQLFSEDDAAIAAFVSRNDQPGRSVFECPNPLKPGSRTRDKETILQDETIVSDLDFRTIEEDPKEVDRILVEKFARAIEPTYVVKSGGGLHVKFKLKEPVAPDDPSAQRVRDFLIWLLAADPMVCNPASLIRVEGTHNTKYGEPVLVERDWGSENPVDLSELVDLIDEFSGPLLTRKAKDNGPGANGAAPRPPMSPSTTTRRSPRWRWAATFTTQKLGQ
jgi:hypothetical protein